MKLWNLWKNLQSHKSTVCEDEEVSDEIVKVTETLSHAEEKLALSKAQTYELAKAVASARRIRYRVDNFTVAMYDNMRGRNNHG